MSHFTALVVGDDIEEQLAPYHEFECTGQDDEFVQTIDQTEVAREEYLKATTQALQAPDGTIHSWWDEEGNYKEEFQRSPTAEELAEILSGERLALRTTGYGVNTVVIEPPADWVEVEVLRSSVESFAKFVESWYGHPIVPFGETPNLQGDHKYGYTTVDENGEVVATFDRTNPNKEWDWYVVGGRWSGFFKLKPGAEAAEVDPDLGRGEAAVGRANSAKKGDIDIEGMRNEAGEEAAAKYDKFVTLTAGCPPLDPWSVVRERHSGNIDAARNEYNDHPTVLALNNSNDEDARWWIFDGLDQFLVSREEYIQRARNRAMTTFAVVKDGKWFEKGDMGWWGMVVDEKDQEVWNREFAALIDGLSDDTLLTVVDCHI